MQRLNQITAAEQIHQPCQYLQVQAFAARRNGDHKHKVYRFPVRGTPIHTVAQKQGRYARRRHTGVAGMRQRDAAADGRCTAEGLPVADGIIIGIAVGNNADALLQLHQNTQCIGRVVDLCMEQNALRVHQFADFHRQTLFGQPSVLPIRLYRYSPTAPSAQVQVVTWSAAALTSAGALATATA